MLTRRKYNLTIGAIVLLGLVINVLTCMFCMEFAVKHAFGVLIADVIVGFSGIALTRSKSPLTSFIGYLMLVCPFGLALSTVLYAYGGVKAPIVLQAFMLTAVITTTMLVLGMVFQDFFLKLGNILFGILAGLVIASFICLFIGTFPTVLAYIGATLFSAYIGYDISVAQKLEPTLDNAVDSAASLYLDIINLFMDLLRIMDKK